MEIRKRRIPGNNSFGQHDHTIEFIDSGLITILRRSYRTLFLYFFISQFHVFSAFIANK